MAGRERTTVQAVAVVVAVGVLATTAFVLLGLPTWSFRAAQGLVGITVGALVDVDTLQRMGSILLVVIAPSC